MEPKPMELVGPPLSEGLSFEEWALEYAFDLTERREFGGVQQLHVWWTRREPRQKRVWVMLRWRRRRPKPRQKPHRRSQR